MLIYVLLAAAVDTQTQHSVQQSVNIVQDCFVTNPTVFTQRQLRRNFPGRNTPSRLTVMRESTTGKDEPDALVTQA